jgi:glycosyltransferase involved in cell wall biosynthesis
MITAIIPTYKRPQLLKRAVRSVLNQTYKDFTILIADNASGPETDAVIDSLMQQDRRIKCFKQPTHVGLADNFQSALQKTNTPFVCFLPDDDFYAPTFFEEAVSKFSEYPQIAFAGGGGDLYINQELEIQYRLLEYPKTGYYEPPQALLANFRTSSGIQLPPSLFKTSCVKAVGGFDCRIKFTIDADLINKCTSRFPVYLITDRIFYFYYLNPTSLSRSFGYLEQEKDASYLHEHILLSSMASQDKEVVDRWFREWKLKVYSKLYGHYYAEKEFQNAFSYASKHYELSNSLSWKRRKTRTQLFHRFPVCHTLYTLIQNTERFLRKKIKNGPLINQEMPKYANHPEAQKWKAYALSLET